MSAPTTPGTAVPAPPAVPAEHLTRWLVALDHLQSDVLFGLSARGVAQRLHDVADDIRATRQHTRNTQ